MSRVLEWVWKFPPPSSPHAQSAWGGGNRWGANFSTKNNEFEIFEQAKGSLAGLEVFPSNVQSD